MSKKSHWRRWGSNMEEMTREEKEVYRKRSFKNGLMVDRMPVVKHSMRRMKKNTESEDTED